MSETAVLDPETTSESASQLLAVQADNLHSLNTRLEAFPEARAAVNEAVAILRDASIAVRDATAVPRPVRKRRG